MTSRSVLAWFAAHAAQRVINIRASGGGRMRLIARIAVSNAPSPDGATSSSPLSSEESATAPQSRRPIPSGIVFEALSLE